MINTENQTANFEKTSILDVADIFASSLRELDVNIMELECEKLSQFVCACYSTQNRTFHNISHAIDIGHGCSPQGKLAALYHDSVYLQVDGAPLHELRSLFEIFRPTDQLKLTIPSLSDLQEDIWALVSLKTFNFKQGQIIDPSSGINEFLSAWIAIKQLSNILKPKDMLHVIACIEATIPFRGDQTPSASERLRSNIELSSKDLRLDLPMMELDKIIEDSVQMANNDVKGFGEETPAIFIRNTWDLLYENNSDLHNVFFRVSQYRESLVKTENFLSTMSSKKIFSRFKTFPDAKSFNALKKKATHNISTTRHYLKAKILDAAILEAFALISGGDCPFEIFLGSRSAGRFPSTENFKSLLDWTLISNSNNKNDEVLCLLKDKRVSDSRYYFKDTTLAAYIYKSLSKAEFESAIDSAFKMFRKEHSPKSFLDSLPSKIVEHLGEILSRIAWTRASTIEKYIQSHRIKTARKVA